MTEDHESLLERLLARSMVGLLTIQGKCAGLGAKSDHISSHLPITFQKLGVSNRAEAVAKALLDRLINP